MGLSAQADTLSMHKWLKFIALFEAAKGLLSLLVGLGLHQLGSYRLQQMLVTALSHLHLNPGSQWPGVIQKQLGALDNNKLTLIALGALAYSIVRLIEAYGLWHEYVWTEWLALLSGAIYLPFEFYEAVVKHNAISFGMLLINVLVVLYLYWLLQARRNSLEDLSGG